MWVGVGDLGCSPFGGIPRNWKLAVARDVEVLDDGGSPFGGIPRNWKLELLPSPTRRLTRVPPSGGSLEIGNVNHNNLL